MSSQHEGDKEPCSCLNKLVGVEESYGDEKDNEGHGCCFGEVILVGLPAIMR